MFEFVEDGKERYVAANQQEVDERYARRRAEIKEFYAVSAQDNFLKRWIRRALMLDIARVKHELSGSDTLYLSEINTDQKIKISKSLGVLESL